MGGRRVGLIDLDTSHPEGWVPEFRALGWTPALCWDGGDTRPPNFADEFAKTHGLKAVGDFRDMLGSVDLVVVHSANWDRHIERARPFVEAGVPVLVDKPLAGNPRDLGILLDWARQGKRVAGGSGLRFAGEAKAFLAEPEAERGEVHTLFAGCGVDPFNYGIHGYALSGALMGPGIVAAKWLGRTKQEQVELTWAGGRKAYLSLSGGPWLPFWATAITPKRVAALSVDTKTIYRNFLAAVLPYLGGEADRPPATLAETAEAEFAALAARESRRLGGAEVALSDLRLDDPGYDGAAFAAEYRRARLAAG